MERHNMILHTLVHEKQYGYGHHYKLTCSCGLDTGWSASEPSPGAHRREVIDRRLGLEFSTERAKAVHERG